MRVKHTMYMKETSVTEICNIIKRFIAKESQDTKEQSNFLIKKMNPVICEWISILINI